MFGLIAGWLWPSESLAADSVDDDCLPVVNESAIEERQSPTVREIRMDSSTIQRTSKEFISACHEGNLTLVNEYLENGLYWPNGLVLAVMNGHIEAVKAITSHGYHCGQALYTAADIGSVEMVQMLLDAGATDSTALFAAVRSGHVDIVKILAPLYPVDNLCLAYARGNPLVLGALKNIS